MSSERGRDAAKHAARAGGMKLKASNASNSRSQVTSGLQPAMSRPAMATIDAGRAEGRNLQYSHGRVSQAGNGSKNPELRNQHMQTSGSNVNHHAGGYTAPSNMISGGFVSSSQQMQLRAPAERQMAQGSRFSRGPIKDSPSYTFNNQKSNN